LKATNSKPDLGCSSSRELPDTVLLNACPLALFTLSPYSLTIISSLLHRRNNVDRSRAKTKDSNKKEGKKENRGMFYF
jgi:hypothetical protein